MATIKRNGEKVVLKDGKVSCSCCEGPSECCMYPAAALVASLYSHEDLPDAIDVGSIEYTKLDPPESVGGFTQYYINSNSEYLGILEGEGEDSTWTYEGGGGPCLINGFNGEGGEREDQFADTYTVTYLPNPLPGQQSISVTVSRTSLCVWEGLDGCGRPWYLIYGDSIFGAGSAYTWKVAMAIDEDNPCDDFVQQPQEKNSNEFNNTPVGNYTQGDYPASVL